MLNRCLFVTTSLLLFSPFALSAGTFPADFQEAVTLYNAGKTAEAEAAFLELAAQPVRPAGRDAALERAVSCALRRKDFEQTAKLTDRIQDQPLRTLCQMRVLQEQRRWKELLALAGPEKLGAWPDRLIFDAAMARGKAYAIEGDAAAETDFQLARQSTFDARERAFADLSLGNLYRDQLHNESKALQAFRAVADSSVLGAIKFEGVMAVAALLAGHDKGQAALAELDKLKVDTIPYPYWACRIHAAYGDVYAAMGQTADAEASYRKAIAVPDAPPDLVAGIEGKLAAMENR